MKPILLPLFAITLFLVSCSNDSTDLATGGNGNGGGTNTDQVDITASAWQLYSKDLVTAAGNSYTYTGRQPTECYEILQFTSADSLIQLDSCSGSALVKYQESWHAYSATSAQVEVYSSDRDERFKSLFSLSKDTMQLRVLPDSVAGTTQQRILTYRAVPK